MVVIFITVAELTHSAHSLCNSSTAHAGLAERELKIPPETPPVNSGLTPTAGCNSDLQRSASINMMAKTFLKLPDSKIQPSSLENSSFSGPCFWLEKKTNRNYFTPNFHLFLLRPNCSERTSVFSGQSPPHPILSDLRRAS